MLNHTKKHKEYVPRHYNVSINDLVERLRHLDSALQLSGTHLVATYARQTVSRLDDVAELEERIHLVDESQAEWGKFAESAKNLDTTKRNIVFIQKNAVDIFSKEEQQQQPDAVGEGAGASKADNDKSNAVDAPLSEDVSEAVTQPVVEEKVEEDKKKKTTKKEDEKKKKKKKEEEKKASGRRGRSGSASESNASERRVSPRIASMSNTPKKLKK